MRVFTVFTCLWSHFWNEKKFLEYYFKNGLYYTQRRYIQDVCIWRILKLDKWENHKEHVHHILETIFTTNSEHWWQPTFYIFTGFFLSCGSLLHHFPTWMDTVKQDPRDQPQLHINLGLACLFRHRQEFFVLLHFGCSRNKQLIECCFGLIIDLEFSSKWAIWHVVRWELSMGCAENVTHLECQPMCLFEHLNTWPYSHQWLNGTLFLVVPPEMTQNDLTTIWIDRKFHWYLKLLP